MVAPDDTTFDYLRGRPDAPRDFDAAVEGWRSLVTDEGATFDATVRIDAKAVRPFVTWGPAPRRPSRSTGVRARRRPHALAYMGLTAGYGDARRPGRRGLRRLVHQRALDDLRAAADVLRGRTVAPGVRALVVPGSMLVKQQAEAEAWTGCSRRRGSSGATPACSMCLRHEPRRAGGRPTLRVHVEPQLRGAAGARRRTHLVSPPVAAATAIRRPLRDACGLVVKAFTTHTGTLVPLPRASIDTDQIIAATMAG